MIKLTKKEKREIFRKASHKFLVGEPEVVVAVNNAWYALKLTERLDVKIVNSVAVHKFLVKFGAGLIDTQEANELGNILIEKDIIICNKLIDKVEKRKGKMFIPNGIKSKRKDRHKMNHKLLRRWTTFIVKFDTIHMHLGGNVANIYSIANKGMNNHQKFKWLRGKYPSYVESMRKLYPKKNFKMEHEK